MDSVKRGQRLALADMLGWVIPKGTPITNVVVITANYYGRPDHALVKITDTNSTMRGYQVVVHVDNLVKRNMNENGE